MLFILLKQISSLFQVPNHFLVSVTFVITFLLFFYLYYTRIHTRICIFGLGRYGDDYYKEFNLK